MIREAARAAIVVVLALLAVLAIRKVAIDPYLCDAAVRGLSDDTNRVESLDSWSGPTLARRTLARAQELSARCPTNMPMYMIAAANQRLLGHGEEAAETYIRALAIEQRPEIYAALADTYFALGRQDACVDALARAMQFAPGYVSRAPTSDIGDLARQRASQSLVERRR